MSSANLVTSMGRGGARAVVSVCFLGRSILSLSCFPANLSILHTLLKLLLVLAGLDQLRFEGAHLALCQVACTYSTCVCDITTSISIEISSSTHIHITSSKHVPVIPVTGFKISPFVICAVAFE